MLPRTQILNASDTSIGITQDISTRSLNTVSVGDSAGKISTGTNNAFVGVQAGAQNTTGSYVTAVGFQAAAQNNNSSYSTMIGAYAGAQNLSGNEVVFTGFRAGELNKFGGQHVGIGAYALRENVSGNASVAVGYRAGERTLDGGYNTMIGAYSGQDNRSGNFNTMGGYSAGRSAFLGNENTYFGAFAGYSNSRGSGNSLFGYRSGANLKFGDLNVAIGAYSLESATYAYSNVVIGPFAGKNQSGNSTNNVLIGTDVATNSKTKDSVIIGTSAGKNLIGSGLVVIGSEAANSTTLIHGNCNILIGTGANLFSDSNNFGIAIGNLNTLTYTNSVSIGININNESQNSVIIGNTLTSDAPQSVVIGNEITLQSVKFYKDPLYYSYKDIALTDASNIFSITTIDYTDTLISPLGEIYQNATATIISSNQINSITNRQLNTIGPPRVRNQLPYNLIQNASNLNSNYAYAQSSFFSIKNTSDTSNLLYFNPQNIYTDALYITSNAPTPPYQLSNYYHIHQLNPFIQFIGETSNVTYTRSNVLTGVISTYVAQCNLPVHPVIVNFTQLNPPTLTSPIYIAKTVTPAIYNYRGQTITVPTSPLFTTDIQFNTTQVNWNFTVNSNLGITIPDCNIVYTVSKLPKYGKLNNTIYTIDTVQSIVYSPFTEYAHNTADSFEIMPIFSINDAESCNYGLQASNGITFNIQFAPYNEIYQANQITFETHTVKTLSLNDIILDSIPLYNSNTMYINVTYIDPGSIITSNQIEFTDSDIAVMTEKNISQYPNSLAPVLYNTTVNSIFVATLCNLSYYRTDHLPILCGMSNDSSNLYNTLRLDTTTPLDKLQSISNIYISTQKLIDSVPLSTDRTKTTSDDLSTQISIWNTVYDPAQIYIETTNLLTNYQSFYYKYYQNQLFNVWSNLNVIKPLFPSVYPISSNVATNLQKTLLNTNNIFNNINYINSGLSAIQYTNAIYPSYYTLYEKYYNSPRLFISYFDLQSGIIKLKQNSNITAGRIDFILDNSNITVPIFTHSNIKTWENIQESFTINILTSNSNIFTSRLPLLEISDYFIQTTSSNALLFPQNNQNLSNTEIYIHNPWEKYTNFDITVTKDNKYLTRHFTYVYDSSTRTLPVTLGIPTPRLDIINQYYEYQVDTIYKVQSNTDITYTSNQGVLSNVTIFYKPIQYNSNVGYLITTSNISLSNIYDISVVSFGNASNIYTTHIYTSYSYSNTSNLFESFTSNYSINTTRSLNILFPTLNSNITNYTSNIIKAVAYFDVYGTDVTIITSNQNHYENYDYNTNKYIYHSDDSIIKILNPQISTTKYLYNQPGPYIVSYRSNITIHYNYNKFQSYQKINKLLLFSHSNQTYSTPNVYSLLFINSNIGRPVNRWNSTDDIYITGSSFNNTCNHQLFINTLPVNIKTIPAYGNNTNVRVSDSITIEIDPNTMKSPVATIFSDSLNFPATDIHIINIQKGSIVSDSTLITNFPISSIQNVNYLAAYRATEDVIQYFYSSNNVYASSNYTKSLKFIHTAGNLIQGYNIGLSSFNNTLNPNILYYSIPGSNLSIRFKTIPPEVNIQNTFSLYQTSNIQVYISKTGSYQLTYDVFDTNYQTIRYENRQLNIRAYEHYEFPLSNIDATSLAIQNIAYDWENIQIGSFWGKIHSLKVQGTNFNTSELKLITTEYPSQGYLKNSLVYDDILNSRIRYIPFNRLENIAGLSNDTMKFRLLYNSNVISPEYTLNIKNYVCRFHPRIINAASFDYIANPGAKSFGMIQDALEFSTPCNITFPKNTLESRHILWNLSNYVFTENVATFNSAKSPILISRDPITLNVDESDSVNFTSLANYIVAGNNDTYFYITQSPTYGIIQNTLTGNITGRFTQRELNTTVYQHIGQNLNTDTIKIAVSSSPYDLSLNEITVYININAMPTVANNYSQYIYYSTSNSAINNTNLIESDTLGITTGYIHVFENTLSNIQIPQTTISYLDPINFKFNADYVKSSAPYPQYGFDFSYNNSIQSGYINRLAQIPIYTNLYKNHFTGYFNQNTDINDITYSPNPNQSISYYITENSKLFNNNILSTLIQFQNDMSLNTDQMAFLYNNKFTIRYYSKSTILLEITITRTNWYITANGKSYNGLHDTVINNVLTTLLVVNYDNFNNNYLSLYWNYDIGNTNNTNLLKGEKITVNLANLNRIEINVPIYDALNYISASNFTRKIDGGDLRASYTLRNYNTKHRFQNFELYVGNLADIKNESHNVILGKSISVRGTNNICVGNTFSTSGEASLIIGNNIGGGGVNEINRSIIIGNDSFAESSIFKVISIGNSNLNYLRKNPDAIVQQSVNKFLSQYPILIGNSIGIDKIDFNINIGNVFLKTSIDPNNPLYGQNDQIYLGNSGEKVGIGYRSNVGLTDMLQVNGDISANTIKVKNWSIKNLIDTVPCITANSIDSIQQYYVVSSTGVYNTDGTVNVRRSRLNDYNVIGICLQTSPLTIGISGHTKVWCAGKVTVGDFLATNANGIAYSARHQTITQTVTTTTGGTTQQKYVVKKVVNGVPIFVGQSDTGNTTTDGGTTTTTTTPIELISSYTFGKSMTSWDPDNPVSWITTKYADTGEFVGLIGCIVTY